jgi:hypothetical protein
VAIWEPGPAWEKFIFLLDQLLKFGKVEAPEGREAGDIGQGQGKRKKGRGGKERCQEEGQGQGRKKSNGTGKVKMEKGGTEQGKDEQW